MSNAHQGHGVRHWEPATPTTASTENGFAATHTQKCDVKDVINSAGATARRMKRLQRRFGHRRLSVSTTQNRMGKKKERPGATPQAALAGSLPGCQAGLNLFRRLILAPS